MVIRPLPNRAGQLGRTGYQGMSIPARPNVPYQHITTRDYDGRILTGTAFEAAIDQSQEAARLREPRNPVVASQSTHRDRAVDIYSGHRLVIDIDMLECCAVDLTDAGLHTRLEAVNGEILDQ